MQKQVYENECYISFITPKKFKHISLSNLNIDLNPETLCIVAFLNENSSHKNNNIRMAESWMEMIDYGIEVKKYSIKESLRQEDIHKEDNGKYSIVPNKESVIFNISEVKSYPLKGGDFIFIRSITRNPTRSMRNQKISAKIFFFAGNENISLSFILWEKEKNQLSKNEINSFIHFFKTIEFE